MGSGDDAEDKQKCKLILVIPHIQSFHLLLYQKVLNFTMSDSESSAPQKNNEKLTEGEVDVLKSHLEEWKKAAGQDKKDIQMTIITKAKLHAPKMDATLLKKRKSVSG